MLVFNWTCHFPFSMKNKTFLRVEFFFSLKKYLSEMVGGILCFIYVQEADNTSVMVD